MSLSATGTSAPQLVHFPRQRLDFKHLFEQALHKIVEY